MMVDWLQEVDYDGCNIQRAGPLPERGPVLPQETQPVSEHSPLLSRQYRQTRCVRIFWIVFLSAFLCTGVTIGCYLISEEDREYRVTGPYLLINRSGWRASPVSVPIPKYPGQLSNVVITQTSTANCDSTNECTKILRNIQKDHISNKHLTDIAYNFLVAGDGGTYEGRGWSLQPELEHIVPNKTLVIAFLGNFDLTVPVKSQIKECQVLLHEAVERKALNPCFSMTLYRDRPQDGGGELVHVFNRLLAENNRRKLQMKCADI